MKSYLFAYSQACPPEQAHAVLNATNAVHFWIAPFPYSAIVISHLDSPDLAAVLRQRLPNIWILVTEMSTYSTNGWLPQNLWEYVGNPSQAITQQLYPPTPPNQPPTPV